MILHTINKPPSNTDLNTQVFEVLSSEDSILFIEDGVYHLRNQKQIEKWMTTAKQIYALIDDAKARGASTDLNNVTFISYTQFVELAANHDKVISWY